MRLLPIFLGWFAFVLSASAQPAISAGRYHNLALTADGTVLWWGAKPGMRQKVGDLGPPSFPQRVDGMPPAIAVAAGWAHSSAITRDGKVYEWGFSPYRQRQVYLAHPFLGLCVVPAFLSGGHGGSPCGKAEMARNARMLVDKPMQIPDLPPAVAIAAGDDATAIVTRDGNVYCWHARSAPVKIPRLDHIRAIALGQFHGIALREDGVVFGFGVRANGGFAPGAGDVDNVCSDPAPRPFSSGAIAIAAGHNDTYVLRADGSIWAWGSNWSGDASLVKDANPDNKPDEYVARRVATLKGAVALGGGRAPSALAQDGHVISWMTDTFLPPNRRVPAETRDIVALASDSSVLALRRDGFLCTMGDNLSGTTLPGDKALHVATFVPLPMAQGKPPLNLVDSTRAAPPDLCSDN